MNSSERTRAPNKREVADPYWINPEYPTDRQGERLVLATLVDTPHLIPDVMTLIEGGDVFSDDAYRALYEVLCELYQEGKTIRLSTIIQRLNIKSKTHLLAEAGVDLAMLANDARATDCLQTALYLRGLWIKRKALDGARDIQLSVRNNFSVEQVADLASGLSQTITEGLAVGRDRSMKDYAAEYLRRLDTVLASPGKLTGIHTGSGKLNKITGGWQDSDIIMIAGRPGAGKSVAGVFHAEAAAAAGLPVAFLSLEMPAISLINRMVSARTGIPYSDIKKGNISREQAALIHQAMGHIDRLPIHWYDDFNRDINDLTYKLLYWKKKYGIRLVIIDYVQLMTDRTVRGGSEYDVLTEVSKKLQQLRKRLGIPIIELAQLNRSVETRGGSKRPIMSDLRSTGQFEQDASVIVMLYREDYYAERAAQEEADRSGIYTEPIRTHRFEYGFTKNRDGDTGAVVLWGDVSLNQVFDEAPSGLYVPQSKGLTPIASLANVPANFYEREPNDEDTPF